MSKVKILLVGSVGENVPVLRKKLKVLNASKAGPFDACFCVGPIHLGDDTDGSNINEAFPIPVYLQDGVKGKVAESSVGATTSCCEQGIVSLGGENTNLYHLRGSSSNINQLRMFQIKLGKNDPLLVASCPRHIRASTQQQNQSQQQQQCDILLSPDWPQGMEDILNVDTEPLSYDVAEVVLACRPRYHVCPSSKLYHVSPPYHLPKSDHVGRFLALGPVTKEKKTPKTHKFIHALGLVPLTSNPGPTTAPSTLPCPFGAAAGTPSAAIQNSSNTTGSTAVPKFAMKGEAYDAAYSRFGANNKRTRDNNNNSNSNNFSLEPPEDPTISTLFLYGLHKDVTGELQSTRSPKVLLAFGKHGVTRVRHPPNVPTSTYCFLEFPSQKEAAQCLQNCHGRITIDSVNLTLKWATPPKQNDNSNKRQRRDDRHPHQQHFVTQSEAKDSTTLFFHPPKDTKLERSDNGNNNDKNSNSSNGVEKQDGIDSTTDSEDKPSIASAEKTEAVEQTDTTTKESSNAGNENEEEEKITLNNTTKVISENQEISPKIASKDEMDKVEGTDIAATTGKDEEAENTDTATKSGPPSEEEKDKTGSNAKATGFAGILQNYVQKVLEHSLNEGVENEDERVTAETEPALKVEVRCKEQYGFLEFASNAAATMALAAITKSTDGGLLIAQPEGALVAPSPDLVGTTLRWAKGSSTGNKKRNGNKGGRDEVLEALGLKRQYYPADGRTDCWFCLSSSTCETHLITGVYDEWYTAMPKGPVHPGHILLVPVKHSREGAWTLNQEWVGLLEKVQEHASSTYDADLFVFERAMATRGGYHTHIQCVPIPRDASTRLQSMMMAHAKACGFELRPIQSDLGVKAIIEKNDSYFYAEIRTRMHVHRFLYRRGADEENSSTVPLQFAREVLASVLNNPKLAHWKACVVDKEQETQLASDFRASFNGVASST